MLSRFPFILQKLFLQDVRLRERQKGKVTATKIIQRYIEELSRSKQKQKNKIKAIIKTFI